LGRPLLGGGEAIIFGNKFHQEELPMELGRNKMVAGFFSLALAVLASIGIFSYLHILDLVQFNNLMAKSRRVIKKIDALHNSLVDIQAVQARYIITGDKRFLTAYGQDPGRG
jgi:CHASE3 domain sensor protein